ncbi:putative membrane protein YeiH [Dysgonomonas sp. PH5-45]|uniref:trimeric intracellular cation channel family protein n=1 Tax=unclassified Dysgonomonas TaxID=2630389 RepID=UPI002476D703|nr:MULTISPECIES: trimeric intracellular cation channel family protein [unclassified Dysgonomonas]MDH6355633.1 putative membrane protein YeiH [Dysgonomonas sp. PH5-45]MDH6388530.1 putative membrane protein YeiH [Dysgonomonas sp. PH5-37]
MDYSNFLGFWTEIKLVDIIEFIGTFAFAISGIRLASAKKIDWFGALVVGFVTAIGGGTVRDLLIGVTPFWMQSIVYLFATILAMGIVIYFKKYLVHLNNTFFWFDSIGLGLFVVVGAEKTMAMGFDPWVVIAMGTITGIMGGVIRDILINEIPIVFTQELYAVACIIGAGLFCILSSYNVPLNVNEVATAVTVFVVRFVANRFGIKLPVLKGEKDD